MVVEQRLLEAQVVTRALLRFQVRIGEEIEIRKIPEQLAQRRWLEAGPKAGLEFGLGLRNDHRRSDAKGCVLAELVTDVVAYIGGQKHAPGKRGLQLDVA